MKKVIALIALSITLQAAVPGWFFNPPADDEMYFYGVGESTSLRQAKDEALADISAKMSVSISSKLSKDATVNTSGSSSSYTAQVNINTQSDTKKITFNNFEVVQTGTNDSKTLVLVRVDRPKFFKEQKQILDDTLKEAKRLQTLSAGNKSILDRYQTLKNYLPEIDKAKTVVTILSTYGVECDRVGSTAKLNDFIEYVADVRSNIEFYIQFDSASRYCADALMEALNSEKIKVSRTLNAHSQNLAIVDLKTEVTNRFMQNMYMAKVRTTVSIKSKQGATLNTFIVEASGNSTLDEASALKNASKNFKKKVTEKGIWNFLGIN